MHKKTYSDSHIHTLISFCMRTLLIPIAIPLPFYMPLMHDTYTFLFACVLGAKMLRGGESRGTPAQAIFRKGWYPNSTTHPHVIYTHWHAHHTPHTTYQTPHTQTHSQEAPNLMNKANKKTDAKEIQGNMALIYSTRTSMCTLPSVKLTHKSVPEKQQQREI